MSKARILIEHGDPSALTLLSSMLKSLGHEIDEASNDRVAVRLMERGTVDLLLAGVDPADSDALELLSYMRRKHRQVPVILLLTSPSPERTKEALRLGALAVLRYPTPATELRAAVMQALAPRDSQPNPSTPPTLAASAPSAPVTSQAFAAPPAHPHAATPGAGGYLSNGPYPSPVPPPPPAPSSMYVAQRAEQLAREMGIIGYDPCLRQAIELAGTIAPSRTPVLIVGEPGTGKSLLARMIHALGARRDHPLVVLDGASVAEGLADHDRQGGGGRANGVAASESEDEADWSGKMHQAHGGTLLLDEVAGFPDALQTLLLQALREREYEGGGPHGVFPDVRFLMTTGENLPALVEQGRFRQDLYHRISVICLKLPPLRHRSSDVEALAEHFRARFAHEFGKNIAGFTHDALDALQRHDWPGNVRELEGVIRRGVVLCQGARITSGHLASSLAAPRSSRGFGLAPRSHAPLSIRPLKEALEDPEKRIIIQALQALNWNRQETARVLDINRTTLYKKMKKYGLLVDGPIWVN